MCYKAYCFAFQKSRFWGSSHNCVGLFTLSHKINSHFISLQRPTYQEMNASLLNHFQGVKDYTFSGSVYKDTRVRVKKVLLKVGNLVGFL